MADASGTSSFDASSMNTSSPRASTLLRVNVLDQSGVCLCDKVWEWKQRSSSPADISKLVLSFYQIASQLGHHAGPREVHFTQPREQRNRSKRSVRRAAVMGRHTKNNEQFATTVRMISVKVGAIILGAFHSVRYNDTEETREALEVFLKKLGHKFNKEYSEKLNEFRSKGVFKDIIEEKGKQKLKQEDVMDMFKSFTELIAKKGHQYREVESLGSSDPALDSVLTTED